MSRLTRMGFLALVGMGLSPLAAEACHGCKKTPCVVARPAYECVTEMVPYTAMEKRTRVEYKEVTKTVMTRVPETHYVTKTCTVMKPITETHMVTRTRTICRPVYETQMTTRTETVCRPVTTTRLVTETCMQPTSWNEVVPVMSKCGGGCGLGLFCGKLHGNKCGGMTQVGCKTVTRTCYTAVPVTRQIQETQMISEVRTVQVPVTTCRMVTEQKVESVPVTTCRLVRTTQTRQVPVTTYRCEPKVVTRQVPVCVKECVPVTRYRKVTRRVPVCAEPSYQTVASVNYLAASPQASMQSPISDSIPMTSLQKALPALQGPPPIPAK